LGLKLERRPIVLHLTPLSVAAAPRFEVRFAHPETFPVARIEEAKRGRIVIEVQQSELRVVSFTDSSGRMVNVDTSTPSGKLPYAGRAMRSPYPAFDAGYASSLATANLWGELRHRLSKTVDDIDFRDPGYPVDWAAEARNVATRIQGRRRAITALEVQDVDPSAVAFAARTAELLALTAAFYFEL
jgi:hypothetical protein